MMMVSTITEMVISEGSRNTCKKYKWRKRGMRYIMTISEWMKSRVKFDTYIKLTYGWHRLQQKQKHNHRRGFKRYLTPNRRGHTVHIFNKCPRRILRPKVIYTAFPSLLPDKRSDIHCRPQKLTVDS